MGNMRLPFIDSDLLYEQEYGIWTVSNIYLYLHVHDKFVDVWIYFIQIYPVSEG
jgi:hypothetical protein